MYRRRSDYPMSREFIALPAKPIWSGVILNSSFYALCFWILLGGLGRVRRARRRRLNRCIRCGYDLRGVEHEACSECGIQTS
ncbi:MAG: hypothetical protein O7G85_07055 [Planctomycetota bacterium]|nr:hypothetical protein [Planctomycetota bacterium]